MAELVRRVLEHVDTSDYEGLLAFLRTLWDNNDRRESFREIFIILVRGRMAEGDVDTLISDIHLLPMHRRASFLEEIEINMRNHVPVATFARVELPVSDLSDSHGDHHLVEEIASDRTDNAAGFTFDANDPRVRRRELPQEALDGNGQDGNGPRLPRVPGNLAALANTNAQGEANIPQADVAVGLQQFHNFEGTNDNNDNNNSNPQGET